MENKAKIVGQVPSAPPEWNVALINVVFSGLKKFNQFIAQVGVSADQLEFDGVTGKAKGLNSVYSVCYSNGGIKLTGHGISLLHRATNGNFHLVRTAVSKHGLADRNDLFASMRLDGREHHRSEVNRPHFFANPQVADQLGLELDLAKSIRRLFPTGNLQQFTSHFNQLVSGLRGGIPYSDRDGKHDITPGKLLKHYMLSFVSDGAAIRTLSDQAKNGGLSLLESARCITDETRTKKFLSAVRDSVTRATQQENGLIEVIDAGCGAVPIQAIQAVILNPRVRVTALEFNPASAAAAQQIVEALGLDNQIKVVQADATTFVPEEKAHIIISETLQAGLGGEPVVQILNNLHSHLRQNGRMIPEGVEIKIGLEPLSEIRNSQRTIRTAIEDVKVTDPKWQRTIHYRFGDPLDLITFDITPMIPIVESSAICVGIEVNLGNEVLAHNESLITMPRLVLDGRRLARQDAMIVDQGQPRIYVSYAPGGIPMGLITRKNSH